MAWLELFGWLGAFLTISAYSMRSMLPLRFIALGANLSFITYGAFVPVYPMLFLHVSLLPLNLYRLREILISMKRMREGNEGERPLDALLPYLKPTPFSDGDVIFRKGDPPDRVYYIEKGMVLLPEVGVELTDGTIFGEMGYFTKAAERTTSAICVGDCEIMAIDTKNFMTIYRQHPEFTHYIIRLMAMRLIDGSQKNPDLYAGFAGVSHQDAAEDAAEPSKDPPSAR